MGRIATVAVAALGVTAVAGAETARGARVEKKLTALPATFSGSLVVQFHGDPATGCAARGLCGYAGTVQWTPAPGWQLQTGELLYPGRSFSLQAQDEIGDSPYAGGVTDADTEQQLSGVSPPRASCADSTLTGGQIDLPSAHGEVRFSPASAYTSIVQTRCAGPLNTDLASAMPEAIVTVRAVLRGDRSIDLRGDRSFAANGFAGTVDSTLMLRLGKPGSGGTQTQSPPGPRDRVVTASYDVSVSGSSVDHIRADSSDALCEPLGACGLQGTVSLRPAIGGAGATIAASGPARLPYRDFLTALRLGRPGHAPRSISVYGNVTWHEGAATATLSRGGIACTDSVQAGGSSFGLYPTKVGLRALYYFGGDMSGDAFRTRCPGPFGAPEQPAFAGGTIPWANAAKPRFVLHLQGSQAPRDDGYTQHVDSDLKLTFTRVSVSTGTSSRARTSSSSGY